MIESVEKVEDSGDALEALEGEIRRAGRELTPFHPKRGAAVIFSSGCFNKCKASRCAVLGPIPGNCSNWSINLASGLVKPFSVR